MRFVSRKYELKGVTNNCFKILVYSSNYEVLCEN